MELDAEIRERLLEAISEKFALENVENIEVTSFDVDSDRREVRIVVSITTTTEPKSIAEGYFGLTSKVRTALGSDWKDFFPVITPEIASGANA
ncbi:hypothetical protein [Roseobacter denitrificans]|uniref:hypothetical protein n=1 Tax=Roseobacter denitrificans TaxID=2434 RepID=UPI0002D26659|nr:hypothetical protein [Roseobacter denitrificans]SFG14713.1 hypothetical protein SAMN05443635_108154 [Roseobacter denitrificans OCh 114]